MVRQRSAKPSSAGSIPAVASIALPLPPHFSFLSTVESHGWYLLAPFIWSRDQRILQRPEAVGSDVLDLTIRCTSRKVVVEGGSGAEIEARVRRMLQLDVDTSEFIVRARDSDAHRWVVTARFGRLLCGTTLFEDIVKIIATTNTTWSQTVKMVANLTEECGRPSPSGRKAFPTPADILRRSERELQERCRLGYRAKSIRALAAGVDGGTIDLATISSPQQTTEQLYKSYQTLPGVGPYGAAHLLAMDGRHDFIAVDTEFRRFVRTTYHKGRAVAEKTLLRRYEKWGRWKYLAYWSELWSSVAERLQPAPDGDK